MLEFFFENNFIHGAICEGLYMKHYSITPGVQPLIGIKKSYNPGGFTVLYLIRLRYVFFDDLNPAPFERK